LPGSSPLVDEFGYLLNEAPPVNGTPGMPQMGKRLGELPEEKPWGVADYLADFGEYGKRSLEALRPVIQQGARYAPGGGMVIGNQNMRQAGEDLRQGNYLRAGLGGTLGVLNTGMEVFPPVARAKNAIADALMHAATNMGVRMAGSAPNAASALAVPAARAATGYVSPEIMDLLALRRSTTAQQQ